MLYLVIRIVVSLVAGFSIGVCKICGFSALFTNTNNKFDMSIFWVAIGALATLFLGVVSLIQNFNANKMNKRLTEESLIGSNYSLLEPLSIEIKKLNSKDILYESLAIFTNLAKNSISNGNWLEIIFTLNSLTIIKPMYYTFEKISIKIDDDITYYIGCHKNKRVKFGQKDNKLVCRFYIQLSPIESKKVLCQVFKKNTLSILLEMSYNNPFNIVAKGKYDITFIKKAKDESVQSEIETKYNVFLSNFLDSSFELQNL